MKEKSIKSAGITLIALVITIIVLLILAGISISFVIGNNGIITQAQNAVTTNRKAIAQEQVQMAWIACESAYYEAWSKDTSTKLEDYLTKEKLNAELSATGLITELRNEGDGEYFVKYQSYDQGIEYEFYMQDGTVMGPRLADLVTAKNYGDYIDYGIDLNNNNNTTDDWKIFYADEKGTYIIASEYLPINQTPEKVKITTDSDNNFYWTEDNLMDISGASSISKEAIDIFKLSWVEKHQDSTNTSIKAVATLMDTDAWSDMLTEEVKKKGGKAIGTPTLELWVASWNGKSELNATAYPKLYFATEGGENSNYGYYIGDRLRENGMPGSGQAYDSPSFDINYTKGGLDKLFVPSSTTSYWVASSSAGEKNDSYLNYISPYDYGHSYGLCFSAIWDDGGHSRSYGKGALRPVVYLPANVQGGRQENGIWKIGNVAHVDGSGSNIISSSGS